MGVPQATAERPWLVADIGGTNARFGLVATPAGLPYDVRILAGADYPDLAAAARDYLDEVGGPDPSAACVAVAGPVTGDRIRLTNAAWDFSVEQTRAALALDDLLMVNDFAALAMSLPRLTTADLRPIGGGTRTPGQPLAVLGPGTGLGVAGLIPVGGSWVPLAAEGGHVDLPAVEDREVEAVRILRAEQGVVTAECFLSGAGLERLYRCLAQVDGRRAEPLTAPEITARRHDDPLSAETVRMFCALLGAFAGNVALTLGARGGIFLGGGIVGRIGDVLESSDFRRRFEAKFRMADYVKAIATLIIVAPTPALIGAAAHLDQLTTTP